MPGKIEKHSTRQERKDDTKGNSIEIKAPLDRKTMRWNFEIWRHDLSQEEFVDGLNGIIEAIKTEKKKLGVK